MKQFQDNLKQATRNSKESLTVSIVRGDSIFQTSSKSVTDNTQFYIGCVSQHITAYMLIVSLSQKYPKTPLIELLNQKINLLFPKSSILKAIGKDWTAQVTLLELLTHRSGLADYVDDYFDAHRLKDLNNPIDADQLLHSVTFDPKKKYFSSNSNYLLIGKLIEEINGQSLSDVFDKLVKIPVGMHSSFCPVSLNYSSLKKVPCGKNLAPNLRDVALMNMANVIGTGNIISTKEDLIKWGRYLFKSAPKEIRNVMLNNYGIGPDDGDIINLGLTTVETSYFGKVIVDHGCLDSFESFFGYAPKSDTLIIMLNNNDDDSDLFIENMISLASKPEEDLLSSKVNQEQLTWSWTKKMAEEKASLECTKDSHDGYTQAKPEKLK